MANAYLISEYWYDSMENRDYEGYEPKGIVLTREEAKAIVEAGGLVPGDKKCVYPKKADGTTDFSGNATLETQMNRRFRYRELPILAAQPEPTDHEQRQQSAADHDNSTANWWGFNPHG